MILDSISRFIESTYRDDSVFKITVIASLILNAGLWIALYIKLRPFSYLSESGQIPLHYSANFGVDTLGPWYGVFAIPALGLAVLIFNAVLGYVFYYRERMLSHLLLITQAFIQIALVWAGVFIILLNT